MTAPRILSTETAMVGLGLLGVGWCQVYMEFLVLVEGFRKFGFRKFRIQGWGRSSGLGSLGFGPELGSGTSLGFAKLRRCLGLP